MREKRGGERERGKKGGSVGANQCELPEPRGKEFHLFL